MENYQHATESKQLTFTNYFPKSKIFSHALEK
jgi:hypothetical protein